MHKQIKAHMHEAEWMTGWLDSWFLGLCHTEKLPKLLFCTAAVLYLNRFLSTSEFSLIKSLNYVHNFNQTNQFSFFTGL